MKDLINEYLSEYRKKFKDEAAKREKARKIEDELANLGCDVIEKGALNILKQYNIDIDAIEKENKKLSQKLAERVKKIDQQLAHMPEEEKEKKRQYTRMMQQVALAQHKNVCIPAPPEDIIPDPPDPSAVPEGCRCEVSCDIPLSRIYPVLIVSGKGLSEMRRAEITCDYNWEFTPTTTERYWITPHIEIHGRRVITLEHHCFHNYDDTGTTYEVRMSCSQPDVPFTTPFTTVSTELPPGLRIDDWRWPNHSVYLRAGYRTEVHIRIRLEARARCRYAVTKLNFGDPKESNYIAIPWLCYMGFSEWH